MAVKNYPALSDSKPPLERCGGIYPRKFVAQTLQIFISDVKHMELTSRSKYKWYQEKFMKRTVYDVLFYIL